MFFKTYDAANTFLNNKTLLERGYSLFIPSNLVSCKGIIRFIDRDITEEEIKGNASSYNVNIINVKRLNRRIFNNDTKTSTFVPTSTVLFTFSGKILPRFVDIYGLPMPVEPYILPVIQCQQCFLYGHTKKNCNSQEKCRNCADPLKKHREDCKTKCLHCFSSDHTSNSRNCPEYERQKLMRQIMSLDNISYFDANLRVPKTVRNIEYHHNPEEYPSINKQQQIKVIHVNERRNYAPQAISYSRVVRKRTKPSSPIEKVPGFDRVAHNACLYNPNGRIPSSPRNSSQNTKSLVDTTNETNTTEKINTIFKIIADMTVTGRELFFNELSNTFNRNYNQSKQDGGQLDFPSFSQP